MDLFNDLPYEPVNILPRDGLAHYYGAALDSAVADRYFIALMASIAWRHDEVLIYGKHIVTKRKVAWYADMPFEYTYSNITKVALPWTKELVEIKTLVEQRSGDTFNSCLLNLYHSGDEGMAWHSDAEPDLKKHGAIASLSLGGARKFSFKHNATKETVSLILNHGDLLLMRGTTQQHWCHSLPTTKKVVEARINLTFRTIV